MSLALIAGTGGLPPVLVAALPQRPLVCALRGFEPEVAPDMTFRIEHLGSFLKTLQAAGVTEICMAGAIRRPEIDADALDVDTLPLVPRIVQAMQQGDDAALRIVIAIFEDHGFAVRAAHEIAPDLLPRAGVLTKAQPAAWHHKDAQVGEACIAALGAADVGQACLVRVGQVIATEGPEGTAAMIATGHASYDPPLADDPLTAAMDVATDMFGAVADMIAGTPEAEPVIADDGILFKGPKPDQDRRADLPLIGLDTVIQAAEAGLAGIVIEAGGVMVLELDAVVATLDAQAMFLWVRPRGSSVGAA